MNSSTHYKPSYTHLLIKPDSNVEITDLYSTEDVARIRNESNRYSEYSAGGSLGQVYAFDEGSRGGHSDTELVTKCSITQAQYRGLIERLSSLETIVHTLEEQNAQLNKEIIRLQAKPRRTRSLIS